MRTFNRIRANISAVQGDDQAAAVAAVAYLVAVGVTGALWVFTFLTVTAVVFWIAMIAAIVRWV